MDKEEIDTKYNTSKYMTLFFITMFISCILIGTYNNLRIVIDIGIMAIFPSLFCMFMINWWKHQVEEVTEN